MSHLDLDDSTHPPRKQPRYNFTFENLGWEYEHSGFWTCIDSIEVFGNSSTECLQSACLWLIDQDGGSCGERDLSSLSIEQQLSLELMIRQAIQKQHEKEQR